MNIGKIFESEFKNSIPKEHFYYRFIDGTGAYGGNEKIRFQAKNICDCMVMSRENLYLLELKNTMGTSLPFSNIKYNQLEGLSEINHPKIKAMFIICFRNKEKCYGIEAKKLKQYIENTDRKSIPLEWLEKEGINIKMEKKRVRYKYNLNVLFD